VSTLHIIGAGLAGLSAAIHAKPHWTKVVVYESAPHAGGRCRSYFDNQLGCQIDNGNHLILGAYEATLEYVHAIGSLDTFHVVEPAAIAFVEPETDLTWTLKPDKGPIPFSLFFKSRRVPETGLKELMQDMKNLALADSKESVSNTVNSDSLLFKRLWEPMTLGILNTPANEASTKLLWAALGRTLTKGEKACRPYLAKKGLGPSLIDPAVRQMEHLHFGMRLKSLQKNNDGISRLEFDDEAIAVGEQDSVILALPPERTAELIPGLQAPETSNTILNVHFKLENEGKITGGAPFIGLVGTVSQWLFVNGSIASVTISAADTVNEANVAETVWAEVSPYLEGAGPLPPHRVIREKRATFHQSPNNAAKRPGPQSQHPNLFLAGDWTDTGLPATIESAVLSGKVAEAAARSRILI